MPSNRSQQYCDLDSLSSSSDFQFLQSLLQVLWEYSKNSKGCIINIVVLSVTYEKKSWIYLNCDENIFIENNISKLSV